MRITAPGVIGPHAVQTRRLAVSAVSRAQAWRLAGLAAIVLLAGWLRFANLAALGYVNHYYSAAMTAMLQSWHNFFFVAAEPGGSVSVDKPPLGLWLQALSARIFGVNTLGVLLPELLAGVLSVVVLYHLVQRRAGKLAGLIAALALAITPVVVATDRNNTMDSTLILVLLLAAWAFIKATESGKLRHLLLAASLVGLGFNIKMLQAYLPLPAFYALYFTGARDRLPAKIGKLALASVVLLVVSISWVAAVDLTPADQRPYVGSSGNNSELSLIVDYNGLERLLGMGTRLNRGSLSSLGGFLASRLNGNLGGGQARFGSRGGAGNPGGFSNGGPAAGFSAIGQAGLLRLFRAPLSKEASWLLPLALLGGLIAVCRTRLRWPLQPKHGDVLLWGGWLLAGGLFFSVANFFHEYYLSMVAPPIAALVGISVGELWELRRARSWTAILLLLAGGGATLVQQYGTTLAFVTAAWWLPLVTILFVGAAAALILAQIPEQISMPGAAPRRVKTAHHQDAKTQRTQEITEKTLCPSCLEALVVNGLLSGQKSVPQPASQPLRVRWRRLSSIVHRSSSFLGGTPVAGLEAVSRGAFACLIVALLLTPAIWSGLTTLNPSPNQSLPSAYDGQPSGPPVALDPPPEGSAAAGLDVNRDLLAYLEAHTQGVKYLFAVPSSMQGSDYVIVTGRPVLYLGGFMGQDSVLTSAGLERLVASGDLRFIYWDARSGGFSFSRGSGQPDISAQLLSACVPVPGFETETRNMGAPDGTSAGRSGQQGFGALTLALYDCAGER